MAKEVVEMIWAFDQDYCEGELQTMQEAIIAYGMEWEIIPREDYCRGKVGKSLNDTYPVIFFGTFEVAQQLRLNNRYLAPGVVGNWDQLKCSHYYPLLHTHLMNYKSVYCSWKQLPMMAEELIKVWGGLFIRPDKATKGLPGMVLEESLSQQKYDFYDQFMEPDELMLLAPPQDRSALEKEYRIHMVNHKAVTGSRYKQYGKTDISTFVPDYVFKKADIIGSILESHFDDLGYVIDIAESSTQALSVIELNSLSCSAIYGSNQANLVRAIANAVN